MPTKRKTKYKMSTIKAKGRAERKRRRAKMNKRGKKVVGKRVYKKKYGGKTKKRK